MSRTKIYDYDTPDVSKGAVTEFEVVEDCGGYNDHLIGFGRVEWKPDSSTLIEGYVEIWA